MPKRAKKDPRTAPRTPSRRAKAVGTADREELPALPFYLREWIDRLGLRQTDVAKGSGFGKSYINILCNQNRGREEKPSASAMVRISRAMGITVNDIYTPPPPLFAIEATKKLRADQLAAMASLFAEMNNARQ